MKIQLITIRKNYILKKKKRRENKMKKNKR